MPVIKSVVGGLKQMTSFGHNVFIGEIYDDDRVTLMKDLGHSVFVFLANCNGTPTAVFSPALNSKF